MTIKNYNTPTTPVGPVIAPSFPGPQGNQGNPGVQGNQGNIGLTGPQGNQGIPGTSELVYYDGGNAFSNTAYPIFPLRLDMGSAS
jgi:hypothetical protein